MITKYIRLGVHRQVKNLGDTYNLNNTKEIVEYYNDKNSHTPQYEEVDYLTAIVIKGKYLSKAVFIINGRVRDI